MYTWGYIKEACLAKLDMTLDEVTELGLLNKFPFYANEAMTQICSSVKSKATFAQFVVWNRCEFYKYLTTAHHLPCNYDFKFLDTKFCNVEDLPIAPYNEQDMWHEYHDNAVVFTNELINMPSDFVHFGDDINRVSNFDCGISWTETTREDWVTMGTNKVMFLKPGLYLLSYGARWYTFTPSLDDNEELDIPADIIDAIPSYIVSQCMKIDDESKANVYRTEFEVFLSRMEENNFRTNKTIKIGGDW